MKTSGLVNIEAMASGTPVVAFDICVMPGGYWRRRRLDCERAVCGCVVQLSGESLEQDRTEVEEKAETCVECVRDIL